MSDEKAWLDCFPHLAPERVLGQFVELIGSAWEARRSNFSPSSRENEITNSLVAWMIQAIRRGSPVDSIKWSIEPQVDIPDVEGDGHPVGRCDMAIVLAQSRQYIFECKRLWQEGKKRKTTTKAARKYVKEGVARYLKPAPGAKGKSPQYPAWLGFAGMLGYVMDGSSADALESVKRAIDKYASSHQLEMPCLPSCPVEDSVHFSSEHESCNGSKVSIHHILLPLSNDLAPGNEEGQQKLPVRKMGSRPKS